LIVEVDLRLAAMTVVARRSLFSLSGSAGRRSRIEVEPAEMVEGSSGNERSSPLLKQIDAGVLNIG